jgi:serine/threonine protein kinase
MAPELLNIPERLPSADIFSLGLTLYEMCYSQMQLDKGSVSLPLEGEEWQRIRDGNAIPLVDRPLELVSIIKNMLLPDPGSRPTAKVVSEYQAVTEVNVSLDECISSAPLVTNHPMGISRTASFHPILHSLGASLEGEGGQQFLDRAITPH